MMRWIYWFGWMVFRAAFRSLFGLRVRGREHLIEGGPVLVAANHQSFLDPPLVGTLYATEMHYLARKTLFKGPFKWLYSQWNSIPVDQEKPDMASLKTIIRLLKSGRRVLVFPEGARTEDGSLGSAQAGIGLIAVKAGVPIQPIRIRGAYEALPRGRAWIRLSRIEVAIGPPIVLTDAERRELTGKDGYAIVAGRIMEAIAAL